MDRIITRKIRKNNNNKKQKQLGEDFKVVYISSPVKVKTCASKFKNLVQELTGRHSDLSRFVEINDDNDVDDHKQYLSVVDLVAAGAGDEIDQSTTSRDSSESNYDIRRLQNNNMDIEQGRQRMMSTSCYHHHDEMFVHGLISPFEADHLVDCGSTENYYYIPTF